VPRSHQPVGDWTDWAPDHLDTKGLLQPLRHRLHLRPCVLAHQALLSNHLNLSLRNQIAEWRMEFLGLFVRLAGTWQMHPAHCCCQRRCMQRGRARVTCHSQSEPRALGPISRSASVAAQRSEKPSPSKTISQYDSSMTDLSIDHAVLAD